MGERADESGGNVVWVDFQARRRIRPGDDWLWLMADRCEAQAERATEGVAERLRMVAAAYRAKAEGRA